MFPIASFPLWSVRRRAAALFGTAVATAAERVRQLAAALGAWNVPASIGQLNGATVLMARDAASDDRRPGSSLEVVPADADEGDAQRTSRQPKGDRHDRGSDENLVKAVGARMMEDDALNVAAGMAYFAFLSLPPTILVLFGLAGFFGGEEAAEWATDQLTGVLPEDAATWIDTFVENVVLTQAPGPFSIGLLLALWAASNVFMAVSRALNIAYNVQDERSFIAQRALALGVMLLFVIVLLLGSALLIAGPQIAGLLGLDGALARVWGIVQWVVPFLLVLIAFSMAYYLLPARQEQRHHREILIGALVGTAIWVLATIAFRIYVANFAAYNETYGVLGGIIILMFWLYLTMLVILLGGQVAAELERRAQH